MLSKHHQQGSPSQLWRRSSQLSTALMTAAALMAPVAMMATAAMMAPEALMAVAPGAGQKVG
jgi:hypothetical protein